MPALIRRLVLITVVLAMPSAAFAQDATLSGAITDTTGGALPGVAVTATNQDSGNTFTAVTDGRGAYRIPLRVGAYRISAELSGFNTINRTGLQVLVGQDAIINLQMTPATIQES